MSFQQNTEASDALLAWTAFENRTPCCEPKALLETKSLTLAYHHHVAFRDVNLAINRGCVTAIVGPSGCGKSSYLQSLNRLTDLLPDCHVQGRVLLDGKNIFDGDVDVVTLRRRVGMIFQKPNPFPFSIRKNLTFPLRQHGVRDKAKLEEMMVSSLKSVGLWKEVKNRLHKPAHLLSGGQQQRLCIARALVLNPEVLLFDEPCSALDPMASGTVEALINKLRGHYTTVIVTHNLAQARRLADHVAVFWADQRGGFLVETDSCINIFENPEQDLTRQYILGREG